MSLADPHLLVDSTQVLRQLASENGQPLYHSSWVAWALLPDLPRRRLERHRDGTFAEDGYPPSLK